MSADLSQLQQAIRLLHYTLPLQPNNPLYVPRGDGLDQKIISRIVAPSAPRLLVAGPAGCGKSTELQRMPFLFPASVVVWCPCDQELDLYQLEMPSLLRYVLYRFLVVAQGKRIELTREIQKEARALIGLPEPQASLPNPNPSILDSPPLPVVHNSVESSINLPASPRSFFSSSSPDAPANQIDRITATISRLASEIKNSLPQLVAQAAVALVNLFGRSGGPPVPPTIVLVIDGLEKTPGQRFSIVREFIRSPVLEEFESVIVVPNWEIHGPDSLLLYERTEVFEIPVPENLNFVQQVIARRAANVFSQPALTETARLGGGVVRDGLQLATGAIRAAADAGTSVVDMPHVALAKAAMVRGYMAIFSDDPQGARAFVREVRRTGHLPGHPTIRDRMLSSGALLPREDGTFRVHPLLTAPDFEDLAQTQARG